jgi:tetratricopeptide (TPR) repeat protein
VLELEAETPPQLVSAELLYNAGVACRRLGRDDEALQCFTRACTDASVIKRVGHERSTSTWRPLVMLAHIHADRAEYVQSHGYALRALEFAPGRPEILYLLASAALQAPNHNESLDWIHQLLSGLRDDGYKARARLLLLQLGNAGNSASLLVEALSGEVAGFSEADRLLMLALAHARFGDQPAQLEVLKQAQSKFPDDERVARALGQLAA